MMNYWSLDKLFRRFFSVKAVQMDGTNANAKPNKNPTPLWSRSLYPEMRRWRKSLGLFSKNLSVIRQAQFSECGYACVAMISNFHGHDIDLPTLRQIKEPSMNGSTLFDLVNLFENFDLKARAIRVDMDNLRRVQCPAILHWNMNHFIVLKSINSRYAVIHDPAMGRRKISLAELSNSFTGVVLEVSKAPVFNVVQSTQSIGILDLFKTINGLTNHLIVLLILSLLIETFILTTPFFLQYITDNVVNSNHLNNLYSLCTGFILLSTCHSFVEYVRSHFVIYLSNRISEHFSLGIMAHLLRLPFSYFEQRHKGDILSRFHAMTEIRNKISTDSINTLLDGIVILFVLAIMALYSLKLTLLILCSLTVYLSLRILSYQHVKNQTELSLISHAQINSKFLEIIQSILPLKLYLKEQAMYQEWSNLLVKTMNADVKIAKAGVFYSVVNLFLFNIEHILVITCGALLVMQKQFSIGMLIGFLAYRQTLVSKSLSFIHKIFDYKLVSVQLNRVADILMHPAEMEQSKKIIHQKIRGEIAIYNLQYCYPGSTEAILKNLTLQIKPGEKVVITGPSGIGKTTLLKLLLGLLSPHQGLITIDDIPLNTLGKKNYWSMCASVMQNDTLISGSILDNITFNENQIDMDKVYEVTQLAQIHDDILKMPMNYETLIGDMGSTLSGGQKQRVLLARALYKNPKILFLDEATSHLDVATEIKINQVLKQLQITQIVIAHREETIKMADRIITLKDQ